MEGVSVEECADGGKLLVEAPHVVPLGPGIPLGREVKEKEEKSDLCFIKNAEFDSESQAYLPGTLRGKVVGEKN